MPSHSPFGDQPETPEPELHSRLQRAASSFPYPPTPDLSGRERVRVHRLDKRGEPAAGIPANPRLNRTARKVAAGIGWALVAMVLIIALVLVSPARARVLEWLRIGAVRVSPELGPTPVATFQSASLAGLAGETSLLQALKMAPFPLLLPAYPPDLKEPQRVYLQQIYKTDMVIMVWLKPGSGQDVRLALYQIGEGDVFQKQLLQNVEETTVNGSWALWVTGPYLLTTTGGQVEQRRIVEGRTLIWGAGRLTYRLETDLPLDEARKIAESLGEWKGP